MTNPLILALPSPQILVLATDPAVAGSLVRRVRDFGVSAAAAPQLPADLTGVRGLIVATADVVLPPTTDLALPVLAVGDGFEAVLPADCRWRPCGAAQNGGHTVRVDDQARLWLGNGLPFPAWFRRSKALERVPEGCRATAWDPEGRPVGLDDETGRRFAIQFHPQRRGADAPRQLLRRFVFDVAGCRGDWQVPDQVPHLIDGIRRLADAGPAIVLVGDGLASTVAAALARRALGPERVLAVHADTGVLRQGDSERVQATVQALDLHRVEVHDVADAVWPSLTAAATVEERQAVVVRCLQELARRAGARFGPPGPVCLAGTGDGWEDQGIVPLLQGFDRSDWRQLGRAVGVPDELLTQPAFPMAGLAARCEGPLTAARMALLRHADARVMADLARLHPGLTLAHVAVRLAAPTAAGETLVVEACEADDGLVARPYEGDPGFWASLAERLKAAWPAVRHVYLDLAPLPVGAGPA